MTGPHCHPGGGISAMGTITASNSFFVLLLGSVSVYGLREKIRDMRHATGHGGMKAPQIRVGSADRPDG